MTVAFITGGAGGGLRGHPSLLELSTEVMSLTGCFIV